MDIFAPEKRSAIMARIRGKDTKPELAVRRGLHRIGYRFRLHDRSLPGTPDIVLPKYKAVIQVRGCFWHVHSCPVFRIPKTRRSFWKAKLEGNKRRDRRTDRTLRDMGWGVAVVWECQCRTERLLMSNVHRVDRWLTRRLLRVQESV